MIAGPISTGKITTTVQLQKEKHQLEYRSSTGLNASVMQGISLIKLELGRFLSA